MPLKKKKKVSVTIIGAIIGAIAIVVGAILTPLVQHWLEKPKNENDTNNPVAEYFPLFVGSIHTYTVGRSTPQVGGGDSLVENVSKYTEQVVLVESSPYEKLHVFKVEQTGEIFDLDCSSFEPTVGTVNKWYITDEKNLYVGCSEEDTKQIASALYTQHFLNTPVPEMEIMLPKIVFPLKVNNQWQAFSEIPPIAPDGDTMYRWFVESNEDIETSAGKFSDCFKIVLYTNPDTSFKYVCKGIGVVALEYHHHGSPVNYRVELASYSSTGQP